MFIVICANWSKGKFVNIQNWKKGSFFSILELKEGEGGSVYITSYSLFEFRFHEDLK